MANLLYLAILVTVATVGGKLNTGYESYGYVKKISQNAGQDKLLTSYLKQNCNFSQNEGILQQIEAKLINDNSFSPNNRFNDQNDDQEVINQYKNDLGTGIQLKSNILRILNHLLTYSNNTTDDSEDIQAIEIIIKSLTEKQIFVGKLLPLANILNKSNGVKNLKILFRFLGDVLPTVHKCSTNILERFVEREKDNPHLEEVVHYLFHKIKPQYDIRAKYIDMENYFEPYFNILKKRIDNVQYLDTDLIEKIFLSYPYFKNTLQLQERLSKISNRLEENPDLKIILNKQDLNVKSLLDKITNLVFPFENNRRSLKSEIETKPFWIPETEQKQHVDLIKKIFTHLELYDFPKDVADGLDFLFTKKRQLINLLPDMNVHKNVLETIVELLIKIDKTSKNNPKVPAYIQPLAKSLYQNLKYQFLYNEHQFDTLEKLTVPEMFDFYGHIIEPNFQKALSSLKENLPKSYLRPITIKFGENPRAIFKKYLIQTADRNLENPDLLEKIVDVIQYIDNNGNYVSDTFNENSMTTHKSIITTPNYATKARPTQSDEIVELKNSYEDYSQDKDQPSKIGTENIKNSTPDYNYGNVDKYDLKSLLNNKNVHQRRTDEEIIKEIKSLKEESPTKDFKPIIDLKKQNPDDNTKSIKKILSQEKPKTYLDALSIIKNYFKNIYSTDSTTSNPLDFTTRNSKQVEPIYNDVSSDIKPAKALKNILDTTALSEKDVIKMYNTVQEKNHIIGEHVPFNDFITTLNKMISGRNVNQYPKIVKDAINARRRMGETKSSTTPKTNKVKTESKIIEEKLKTLMEKHILPVNQVESLLKIIKKTSPNDSNLNPKDLIRKNLNKDSIESESTLLSEILTSKRDSTENPIDNSKVTLQSLLSGKIKPDKEITKLIIENQNKPGDSNKKFIKTLNDIIDKKLSLVETKRIDSPADILNDKQKSDLENSSDLPKEVEDGLKYLLDNNIISKSAIDDLNNQLNTKPKNQKDIFNFDNLIHNLHKLSTKDNTKQDEPTSLIDGSNIYISDISNGKRIHGIGQPEDDNELNYLLKNKLISSTEVSDIQNQVKDKPNNKELFDNIIHKAYKLSETNKPKPRFDHRKAYKKPTSLMDIFRPNGRRIYEPDNYNNEEDTKPNDFKKELDFLLKNKVVTSKEVFDLDDKLGPNNKHFQQIIKNIYKLETSGIESVLNNKVPLTTDDKLKLILANDILSEKQIVNLYQNFKTIPQSGKETSFSDFIDWAYNLLKENIDSSELYEPKFIKIPLRKSSDDIPNINIPNPIHYGADLINSYSIPYYPYKNPYPERQVWNKLLVCNDDLNLPHVHTIPYLQSRKANLNFDTNIQQNGVDLERRIQNMYKKINKLSKQKATPRLLWDENAGEKSLIKYLLSTFKKFESAVSEFAKKLNIKRKRKHQSKKIIQDEEKIQTVTQTDSTLSDIVTEGSRRFADNTMTKTTEMTEKTTETTDVTEKTEFTPITATESVGSTLENDLSYQNMKHIYEKTHKIEMQHIKEEKASEIKSLTTS